MPEVMDPEVIEEYLKQKEAETLAEVQRHLRAVHELGYEIRGKVQVTDDGRLVAPIAVVKRSQ